MQQTLTYALNESQVNEIFEYLKGIGTLTPNSNEYVKWCLKGSDWTVLMYTSGKLVLQSKNDVFCKDIKERIFKEDDFQPHIGSDEVGKGDYFGPLVVCACYISKQDLKKIEGYGITDSKKLTDVKILELGVVLKDILNYEVRIISPKEYNELTERFKNVAILLAKAHFEVVEKLLKKIEGRAEFVVIDQFSKNTRRLSDEFNLDIPLRQYHHAESDVAVAAASIIARYSFLLEFQKMNEEYGTKFPLGATHVIGFGKDFVKKYSSQELDNVAKVSFRTTQKILAF